MNKAIEIKKDLHWVGARDYDIEVFDIIMKAENGTTYNSYLIKGSEKIALIELCKEDFFDEFIERISSICDIKDIDYVINNHTEPDHTGSITKILELNKDVLILGSGVGINFIKNISRTPFKSKVVKDGDSLSLGNYNLDFIATPFLHWPDSMMTYCRELKTLFTCDMFGAHFASEELFNDLITKDYSYDYKYYFDAIFSPFKANVLAAIEKIKNLDFDVIANGHGPIIRKDIDKYISLYKEWSLPKKNVKPLVVISYVSAYGYTKKLAEKVKEGILSSGNLECLAYDLSSTPVKDIEEIIERADGLLFGSPTILADALPPINEAINLLNPIIHKGKIAGAFGSYGWSGEAVSNIESRLNSLKLNMPIESFKIKFNPSNEDLDTALNYGKAFGTFLLNK